MKAIVNNRIVQHSCFWGFYAFMFYYNYRDKEPVRISLIVTAVSLPYLIFSSYLQLYFLIPRFLLRKQIVLYLFLTLLFAKVAVDISLIVYGYIVIPLRTGHPPDMHWEMLWTITPNQAYPFYGILTICGFAGSIKLLKKWWLENDRNKKIEKEKTVMELEMLKAQVHPHFLFNTLNNLYSLVLTHSDKAPVAVTHLSDLLRYMLYECTEKEVLLNKEIEVLKKYIELEKLRYGNRIDVSFFYSNNHNDLLIAPLLLLPFVENSFKHGISEQLDQCWISVQLHADEQGFTFSLSNSYNRNKLSAIKGGIGLQNIKKRLDLIYPGQYELSIKEDEEMYLVKLHIHLNCLTTTTRAAEPVPGPNRPAIAI